ncbi:MAG: polysaccharide deacetylase family protein [Bacteroidota bacterium]
MSAPQDTRNPSANPSLVPEGQALRCATMVPAPFEAAARYAIEMLLLPLHLAPHWVEVTDADLDLAYVVEPEAAIDATVVLRGQPETWAYFAKHEPYSEAPLGWVEHGGDRAPVLFAQADGEAPDWVACAFFWLAGWQEHVIAARDEHDRFPYAASYQARWGTVRVPVVDVYRALWQTELEAAGLPVQPRQWDGREWALASTHDIDYVRKWRPGIVYRESVEYLLLNHREVSLPERLRRFGQAMRMATTQPDPCRTALFRIAEEVKQRGGTATYYLKAAARHDRDVGYRLPPLRRFLQHLLADGFEVGLHPSYLSHTDAAFVEEEKARLEAVLEAPLTSIRQHYLRYDPRRTPAMQAATGFRIDSTLGFARHEGFRHGTCQPFRLFDVEQMAPLDLWELPLCLMEGTLFVLRELSAPDAWAATKHLLETVQRYRGVAVMLWHNDLWDDLDFPEWGPHFLRTLDYACDQRARLECNVQLLRSWKT